MSSVFRPGDRCGPYEIVRPLGEGGMGEVLLARSPRGELRALKVLSPSAQAKRELEKRFLGEIQVLSYLSHAHVVRFYEAGVEERPEGAVIWLALEYLEGRTLRSVLAERGGALDEDSIIRWGRQIAQGVHEAHKLRVVHRDLKPENVVVVAEDTAKVIDFGIAKFRDWDGTRARTSGARIGTVLYMAPEQLDPALGVPIDARTDVYGLGVVLYELATGRNPYLEPEGTIDMGALLMKKLAGALPPVRTRAPGLGADVADAVDRACRHDANRRFETMAALDDALGAAWRRRMDERRARMLGARDSDGGPPTATARGTDNSASLAEPVDGQSSRFESVRTLPNAEAPRLRTRSLRDAALLGAALGVGTGLIAYRSLVEPRLDAVSRTGRPSEAASATSIAPTEPPTAARTSAPVERVRTATDTTPTASPSSPLSSASPLSHGSPARPAPLPATSARGTAPSPAATADPGPVLLHAAPPDDG